MAESTSYRVAPEGEEAKAQPSAKDVALASIGKALGDSGTRRFGGFYQEEYLAEWRDERRVDNVESMRRGDADVRAALRAITAPVLATKWSVQTKGADAKAEEMREFVQSCLFNMRGRTFEDFLGEALKYLDFGHYAFELIWEKRDGKIALSDLAPRIPRSILKWKLTDGRFGIVQVLSTDDASSFMPEIPADKLLILTNDKEGDDVTGISVLRSAFKHYIYKDLLYKIQGISAERFGIGIPVVWPADGAGESDKEEAEDMASSMRGNEKGYIVMPGPKSTTGSSGWEVEILTPNGNPQGQQITDAIEHHGKKILQSVLAQFLALGSDGVGSYALSADQSGFFLKEVEQMARYVAQQIGRQVIRRIVDVNYGPQKDEDYPYLAFTPLGDIDFAEMSQTVLTLVQAGMVGPDSRMMEWVRSTFRLPEMTQDQKEREEEREIEKEIADYEDEDPQPTEEKAAL